jgi:pimeloyl-ACP methyl ester carboxylesterase
MITNVISLLAALALLGLHATAPAHQPGGPSEHGPKGQCDDTLERAVKHDSDARILFTRTFRQGEPIALPSTPASPPPPTAAFDICFVKLLVGPGSPGTAGAPSTSAGIGIEMWLPAGDNWNGRIRDYGSGGWAGGVHTNLTLIGTRTIYLAAVNKGYAVGTSDHGHSTENMGGSSGSFAMREDGLINTVLWHDFAERSMHELAVKSKALVKAFYGKPQKYAYWDGYSTGGRQGYKLAQRYPEQFDGILAGAPAFNWSRFITQELYPQLVMQRQFGVPIPVAKLNAVSTAATAACDALGLGFILEPLQCRYNPLTDAAALCSGEAGSGGVVGTSTSAACVTGAEAGAINRIWYGQTRDGSYADPAIDNAGGPFTHTSNHLWFGLARGTQLGLLAGATPFTISSDLVALELQDASLAGPNFFNATGNGQSKWKGLDFPALANAADQGLALQREFSRINTDRADLSGLRRAGGKVISYHGLADDLIPPQGSTNYYERVVAAMGGHEKVQRFNRLYLIPGLAHDGTFGRSGSFDPATGAITSVNKVPLPQPVSGRDELFEALKAWVEGGVAPGRIDLSSANGSVTMPICVYPLKAMHDGSGNPKAASSYACR